MTPFEQEVRKALSEINVVGFLQVLRTAGGDDSVAAVRDYFDVLGKRVAAAIDELAMAYAEDVTGERGNPTTDPGEEQRILESLRADALKKLRGEP